MTREIEAGRLIGGSATATAEALLGLLALQRAEPLASHRSTRGRRPPASSCRVRRGQCRRPPWGARVDSPDRRLARVGRAIDRSAGAGADRFWTSRVRRRARKEADGLWGRFLLAGRVPAAVAPDGAVSWYPQIAYGVGSVVEGYLALADATGEPRYAVFAGLTAGWFLGANPARLSMYDEKTGRTFDGIDGPTPLKVNRNAGAESTIEALLALQRVDQQSRRRRSIMRYRPVGSSRTSLANLPDSASTPGRPASGSSLRRRRQARSSRSHASSGAAPITLTYWPAANPAETRLAIASRRAVERRASRRAGARAAAARRPLVGRSPARRDRRQERRPTSARTSRRRCWRGSSAPAASCGSTIASRRPRG